MGLGKMLKRVYTAVVSTPAKQIEKKVEKMAEGVKTVFGTDHTDTLNAFAKSGIPSVTMGPGVAGVNDAATLAKKEAEGKEAARKTQMMDQAKKENEKEKQTRGRASTLLTGPKGLMDSPSVAKRILLGS